MGPFDRNGDGELDGFERAMQMDFIDHVNSEGIYKDSSSYDDYDDFDGDGFDSDYDSFGDDF